MKTIPLDVESCSQVPGTMQDTARKETILCVVNKRLPTGDYRLAYPAESRLYRLMFALPERPNGLPPEDYVPVRFGEGMKWSYLAEFWKLYRFLRRHRSKINLVHFYSTNLILIGPILARLAAVPSVTTLTGFGRVFTSRSRLMKSLQGMYWALLSLTLCLSRRLLLQNHGDMNQLAKRFPKKSNRLRYVGSAVSMRPVRDKDFSTSPLVVIHIARIMEDKGIREFLAVARALKDEAIVFHLIGPPSVGFEDLLHTVEEAAAAGTIKYFGELDSTAIEINLQTSHILFFPSHGEGLARVMLEAGFNRVFPIAYDISSNLDLVPANGGVLLPKGDVDGAVHAIRHLNSDRQRIADQARTFQEHIVRAYGIEPFSQRMDHIYLEIFDEMRS